MSQNSRTKSNQLYVSFSFGNLPYCTKNGVFHTEEILNGKLHFFGSGIY